METSGRTHGQTDRGDRITSLANAVKLQDVTAEYGSWEDVVEELERVIYVGIKLCVDDETMSPDEAANYLMSGE